MALIRETQTGKRHRPVRGSRSEPLGVKQAPRQASSECSPKSRSGNHHHPLSRHRSLRSASSGLLCLSSATIAKTNNHTDGILGTAADTPRISRRMTTALYQGFFRPAADASPTVSTTCSSGNCDCPSFPGIDYFPSKSGFGAKTQATTLLENRLRYANHPLHAAEDAEVLYFDPAYRGLENLRANGTANATSLGLLTESIAASITAAIREGGDSSNSAPAVGNSIGKRDGAWIYPRKMDPTRADNVTQKRPKLLGDGRTILFTPDSVSRAMAITGSGGFEATRTMAADQGDNCIASSISTNQGTDGKTKQKEELASYVVY
ncbi:hypothetical protein BJ170DRAFT_590966 [Xylariales sp. AK1849]|nr:hypothetical protein BJ170DRAFT_590966 [Xylariales sp. AK1849]